MKLNEWIDKRSSCRSYAGIPVDGHMLEQIMSLEMKPLYPEIKVRMDIVGRDKVKCIFPWMAPQLIAVYSEKKPGYLENIGFLFQQMDLHLQSLGLGSCWIGMGKMDPASAPRIEGMEFVILLAFGTPKGDLLRSGSGDFKRKNMSQITDSEDQRLEPARLAPSSINSQPWYFLHDGPVIHMYYSRRPVGGDMNLIDAGIALAHLYVSNLQTFRFFRVDAPPAYRGGEYVGSIEL